MEFEQIVIYPKVSEKDKLDVIEQLRNIREEILNGTSSTFCTKAVLYSEDPGSATKCGELGFVSRNDLVPEFSAVAFNLEPNQVSSVVETEFGYHLIQVVERRGELINVRHILRKPEISEKAVKKAIRTLDSLLTLVRIDTMTFSAAALKFSEEEVSKNNSGLAVNPYTGTSKFEADQLDGTTYYKLKDMKIGEMSAPFETMDMTGKKVYKVVKLRSSSGAHKANLTDDYQRIQELAEGKKKQELIDKWIKKKQRTIYIRIDPSYRGCVFRLDGWIK